MALAGCTGVFVGFESVCEESLDVTGKRTPRAADFARRVAIFHAHGIQVNGSFVFGFDGDRRDVFARTWQLAGRADQLAAPGSFFTTSIGGEPIVVVRGKDGVRRLPEQYLWVHKRFKTRPPGEPNPYRKKAR